MSVSRNRGVDLAVLFAIPLVLVAVHVYVPSARETLVFDHGNPTLLTAWTAGYVHLDATHLRSNVFGYFIAVFPTYVLFLAWNRRRRFWVGMVTLLLAGPVVVSYGNWLVFRLLLDGRAVAASRGFSGVVAGISGVLLVSLVAFVGDEYDRRRAFFGGQLVVLLLVGAELLAISPRVRPIEGTLLLVGVGLAVASLVPVRALGHPTTLWPTVRKNALAVGMLAYSTVALVYLFVALFPTDVVDGGQFTNVYGHAVGFLFGLLVGVGLVAVGDGGDGD